MIVVAGIGYLSGVYWSDRVVIEDIMSGNDFPIMPLSPSNKKDMVTAFLSGRLHQLRDHLPTDRVLIREFCRGRTISKSDDHVFVALALTEEDKQDIELEDGETFDDEGEAIYVRIVSKKDFQEILERASSYRRLLGSVFPESK